jgi:hypothetical protein
MGNFRNTTKYLEPTRTPRKRADWEVIRCCSAADDAYYATGRD